MIPTRSVTGKKTIALESVKAHSPHVGILSQKLWSIYMNRASLQAQSKRALFPFPVFLHALKRRCRLRGALAMTDETIRMGILFLAIALVVVMFGLLYGQWRETNINSLINSIIVTGQRMGSMRGVYTDITTKNVIARKNIPERYITGDKITTPFGGDIAVAGATSQFTITVTGIGKNHCLAVEDAFYPGRGSGIAASSKCDDQGSIKLTVE